MLTTRHFLQVVRLMAQTSDAPDTIVMSREAYDYIVETPAEKQAAFDASVEKSRKRMAKWPQWKRDAANRMRLSPIEGE